MRSNTVQKSFRLPSRTAELMSRIRERCGYTDTQIVVQAIERLHREIMPAASPPAGPSRITKAGEAPAKRRIIMNLPKIIFTQPFLLGESLAAECEGNVAVLDIAFNSRDFETTLSFISALELDNRLKVWVDHHPHRQWLNIQKGIEDFGQGDTYWVLQQTGSCAEIIPHIDKEAISEIGTIVCHGDLDGITSAAMLMALINGVAIDPERVTDAIAADTRQGELSEKGQWYEAALKADLANNNIKLAILKDMVGGGPDGDDEIHIAAEKYAAIRETTDALIAQLPISVEAPHCACAYVDATDAPPIDLTALLLAGQKLTTTCVVKHKGDCGEVYTIAGPKGCDFVSAFHLAGGMPNRVTIPGYIASEDVVYAANGVGQAYEHGPDCACSVCCQVAAHEIFSAH